MLDIFRKKTAPAFEVALRVGALYAGVEQHEEVEDVLHVYSEALGIAYQIRDDLSDLGDTGETNDIAGLRPSLLLAVAHEKAKDAKKEVLASVWRRQLPAGVSVKDIEAIYTEVGADLDNPNLKGLLRRVLGKIFNDVEIKGWCKEQEQMNGIRDGVRVETDVQMPAPRELDVVMAK